ncbi:MAG: NAD-dependent epimerase/dehydratase family protein [Candidatus Hydrothermia bacterium]|nr:NAD-dependent epimerase/dehydratase family protein [Candidatus Hydrothermia bacterium]
MKVLITGGCGFIGSHVQDYYICKGYDVVVVDNLSSGKLEFLNPKAKFYHADVRDYRALEEIFNLERPELVNHHAAQISVIYSTRNPKEDADINIIGIINMLGLSVKYSVKRFLFSSSGGAIYGNPIYLPCDEYHPVDPLSPYGVSKYSGELYIRYYHKNFGLDYAILRYGNVFGPRQDPYGEAGVIAIFTMNMLQSKDCYIYGDGNQESDFIYVEDVAEANLLLSECPLDREREFNIGSGVGISVNNLYEIIKKATGYNRNPIFMPQRKGEVYKIYLNIERIRKLGWTPRVSFEEGIIKILESLKKT